MKVREMIRLLEQAGWIWVRTRGSHRQFVHPSRPVPLTVSGSMGADIPIGLERTLLRRAGLEGKP